MTFAPRLESLPEEQRALWPALAGVPRSFVLYGGTAIALRLGHRVSVDFDFFSSEPLDFEDLFALPFVRESEVLQREPATLTVSTPGKESATPVKVSFFGGIDIGRVGCPERTDDGVVWVAAMLDLFATKLKVLLQRIAERDFPGHRRDSSFRHLARRRSRRGRRSVRHPIPADGGRQSACLVRDR